MKAITVSVPRQFERLALVMSLQFTPYSILFFIITFFSIGLSTLLWRQRMTPGAKPLAGMMAMVSLWNFTAGLEAATVEVPIKILWTQIEYIGSNAAMVFLVLFAMQYSKPERPIKKLGKPALLVLPVFNVLLAATNRWHGLVWTGFEAGPAGSNLLVYQHGPGFYFVLAVVYGYIATAVFWLVRAYGHASLIQRRQIQVLLAGMATPFLASVIYASKIIVLLPGLDIIPISFLVTGAVLLAGIRFFKLFDLVPVARERLIEEMTDGLLVLDASSRLLDFNPAAQRILGLTQESHGQAAGALFGRWPALLAMSECDQEIQAEVQVSDHPPLYLEARNAIMRSARRTRPGGSGGAPQDISQGGLSGRMILLRDITLRRSTQIALQQANERLKTQLGEISALQELLAEQAIRDPLTGLFNRRYLEETMPRELARAMRQKYLVVVVLMDIDHFKQINDTYGHTCGDLYLKTVGDLLVKRVRREDIVCRYGGEEFLLVLPGMPREHATARVEQIRELVQNLCVPFEGEEVSSTVSGGIAIYPDHGTSGEELIRSADRALYAAKAAGRNRLHVAEGEREDIPA